MSEHVARAPHDGSVLGTAQVDTGEAIDAKVARARDAMQEWARSSPVARERALLDVAARTADRLDAVVEALSLAQGKTRKEGLVELDRYLGALTQYAGPATVVGGRSMCLGGGVSGIAERVPAGLVAGIVPWNFPASLFGTKVAPALAAGCGFLIKPAISTALVTQQLVEIANTVLPSGLLEIIVDAGAGERPVRHDGIDRVAFTGSTGVGRSVASGAAEHLKPCTLDGRGSRGRAHGLARRIRAGHTWVNTIARVYDELPFGPARGSGFGREHGIEAMENYTEYRTVVYAGGTGYPRSEGA